MNANRAPAAAKREMLAALAALNEVEPGQWPATMRVTAAGFFARRDDRDYVACVVRGYDGETPITLLVTETLIRGKKNTHAWSQVEEWLALEYNTLVHDGYVFRDGKIVHRGGHTLDYSRYRL